MPNVDEVTFDCRGNCHGGRHKVCPTAGSLAPFEISIAGGSTAFSRLKHVGIHRQTHTAAGFPPFKPRLFKQTVEPFLFGLLFHQTGTGHDHRMNGFRNVPALRQACGHTKILDA
jgi:hypothetical protein